jgi:mannose-1-phosphate guanylyltransferase/mannose-1-phosphate guanylyltransferase/mannose-6-phosphate isomerase
MPALNVKKYSGEKPWGKFERFTHNEPSTVKILIVNAGEELSLQYHRKRSEFWRVISGNGIVQIKDEKFNAAAGNEYLIPPKTAHRLSAGTEPLVVLEISIGDFDEADIVRLEDKYGRVK